MPFPFEQPPSARDNFQQPETEYDPDRDRPLIPGVDTRLSVAPLIAPAPPTPPTIIIPGRPNPFYTPNTPASTPTPTCNCEQSSSTCNCPTPTQTPILSPSTPTDNKKYMYIAGGLIIAFFIFSKK
jgi:hypothetical protein